MSEESVKNEKKQSIFFKEEDVEAYLSSKWPVEESNELYLDDVTESNISHALVFVKKIKGYRFEFAGEYKDKMKRIGKLEKYLSTILYDESIEEETFFTLDGGVLNSFETEAIVGGLKSKDFTNLSLLFLLEHYFEKKQYSQDKLVCLVEQVRHSILKEAVAQQNVVKRKKKKEKYRFHIFGKHFFLVTTSAVNKAVLETLVYLSSNCTECLLNGLFTSPYTEEFQHARYRVAKHLVNCNQHTILKKFCIRQLTRFLPKPKRVRSDTEEEKHSKKMKVDTPLQTAPLEADESQKSILNPNEPNEPEELNEAEELTVVAQNTVVKIEGPQFSTESRERRRNAAATEDEIDDGKAHYLGGKRYDQIKATVKDYQRTVVFNHKAPWVIVMIISIVLFTLQVLVYKAVLPFPTFSAHIGWHWIVFVLLKIFLVWWTTHYRHNRTKDAFIFCSYCILSFWFATAQRAASFPALSYACCSAGILCQHFEKRLLLALPLLLFVSALSIGTFYGIIEPVSTVCKCIITSLSFWVEYRNGTASVSKILLAPIKDINFILTAPLAVYLLLNG